VRAAEISVYIEPYRFCLDSVGTVLAGILREKAANGADVRIILDGRTAFIGSRNIQDKYFFDWHDADVRITGPVIADLTEAFHGNQRNIGLHRQKPLYVAPDLEEAARRDTMPGLEQFFDVPIQVVPEYPTDRNLPTRNCLEWALNHAKRYFWYYNPYSPPPMSTIEALQNAARRGVDVRWIAPSITDIQPERGIAESSNCFIEAVYKFHGFSNASSM
jgi:phosphatidylserine/phosphatidylglycerophosphate/cardiolipin synthase-like enzyme